MHSCIRQVHQHNSHTPPAQADTYLSQTYPNTCRPQSTQIYPYTHILIPKGSFWILAMALPSPQTRAALQHKAATLHRVIQSIV